MFSENFDGSIVQKQTGLPDRPRHRGAHMIGTDTNVGERPENSLVP